MGNAATCSLVDVVGTVTVTQTDGQILEFVQPIFASQVKKLHPGNWLVHYVSMHDPALGKQHGKMSMLQGSEELQAGQIYFLLPIPSHFRKQLFGPNQSKQSSSSSKTGSGASTAAPPPVSLLPDRPPPTPKSQQQPFKLDGSIARSLRQQEPTPVFSMPDSPVSQQHYLQSIRPNKRPKYSSRHKIHVFDWRPTLMTIQEIF